MTIFEEHPCSNNFDGVLSSVVGDVTVSAEIITSLVFTDVSFISSFLVTASAVRCKTCLDIRYVGMYPIQAISSGVARNLLKFYKHQRLDRCNIASAVIACVMLFSKLFEIVKCYYCAPLINMFM